MFDSLVNVNLRSRPRVAVGCERTNTHAFGAKFIDKLARTVSLPEKLGQEVSRHLRRAKDR